jgi:hypothetical protein
MKKYLIAAVVTTFINSGSARAELTDSHYVFLESMSQIVMDNVPCEETAEAMDAKLKKYFNSRFKNAFNSQLKLLGVSKADQRAAFDYYKDLVDMYGEDCVSGDPGDPGEEF